MAPNIDLNELAQAIANVKSNPSQDSGRKYQDVPAKDGELGRAETITFSHTVLDGGAKKWLTQTMPRRISRGVVQDDGSTRGGGNATYSAQTTGGGYELPFGLETEWRVAGIPFPMGPVVRDEQDRNVERRTGIMELVVTKDGNVRARIDGDDTDVADVYRARVRVTKGKQPFFVKVSVQRKASTGFWGLGEGVELEDYED